MHREFDPEPLKVPQLPDFGESFEVPEPFIRESDFPAIVDTRVPPPLPPSETPT
jgi:hypothetical protein